MGYFPIPAISHRFLCGNIMYRNGFQPIKSIFTMTQKKRGAAYEKFLTFLAFILYSLYNGGRKHEKTIK